MFDVIVSLFKPKPDLAELVREGALIIDVRMKAGYYNGHGRI